MDSVFVQLGNSYQKGHSEIINENDRKKIDNSLYRAIICVCVNMYICPSVYPMCHSPSDIRSVSQISKCPQK